MWVRVRVLVCGSGDVSECACGWIGVWMWVLVVERAGSIKESEQHLVGGGSIIYKEGSKFAFLNLRGGGAARKKPMTQTIRNIKGLSGEVKKKDD